jgi:hypothetical protein
MFVRIVLCFRVFSAFCLCLYHKGAAQKFVVASFLVIVISSRLSKAFQSVLPIFVCLLVVEL